MKYVVCLLVCALAGEARADEVNQFVTGAVHRARRAVAIGPFAGTGMSYITAAQDVEVPISFGLQLAVFKIQVLPSPEMIKDIVAEKAKAKLRVVIDTAISQGRTPSQEEVAAWGQQIALETKAEVLAQLDHKPRRFERPRFKLALEGIRTLRAKQWQTRLTAAVGISRVSIGPTVAYQFGDASGTFLGGELGVPALLGDGMRTPVVDMFLRADFPLQDGLGDATQFLLGARLVLDVI